MADSRLRLDETLRAVDFISDLHLSPALPATVAAWERYMAHTSAGALFMLGDLFEVWVGDDARALPFEARCVAVIAETARRLPVWVQHGNRDFLLGTDFAAAAGVRLLADPATLTAFGDRTVLLTHGDELCIDDLPYQVFRKQVRDPGYQARFLAQPLAARLEIAAKMREASRASHDEPVTFADVDPALAREWLARAGTDTLVHGHTHRPGSEVRAGYVRHVLTDWDLDTPVAEHRRSGVLRWTAAGFERLTPAQAEG